MTVKCFIIGWSVFAPGMLASNAAAEGTVLVRSVVATDARTGKLVRKTSVQTLDGSVTKITQSGSLDSLIEESASRNEVEAPLIRSVIRAESNYNPLAVSSKGAQGLMQLIPETAKRFGVKDSFDSRDNLEGGVKYLRYLIDLYRGDYARAVAAYNAGEKAVAKYGGVPPYKETRNYVATVASHLEAERRTTAAKIKSASLAPAEAAGEPRGETYHPVVASVSADGKIYYRTP